MERKIGEEFSLSDGTKLKVIEESSGNSNCDCCYFKDKCTSGSHIRDVEPILGECCNLIRNDGKDIIFVKV